MAATSLGMEGSPCLMNESMILSLLDQSWYLQSILNNSKASPSVPPSVESPAPSIGVEPEVTLRSSEDGARPRYSIDKLEMRTVFDRIDENADGLISGEELRRWCTKCYRKDVSDADTDSMISCVDRNNDGSVDFEELLSLYETHVFAVEEQEDDNKRAFHVEDEDENEESDLMLESFRVFDRNHDGFISAEELQAVLINLGMPEGKSLISCEKMIRKVDRNGDGQCDILEFREMMLLKPAREV